MHSPVPVRRSKHSPRPVAGLVALALLCVTSALGGCGGERRDGSSTGTDTGPAAALAPDGRRALSVYWGDANAERVVPVTRYVDPDSGLARGAVLALLAGPDSAEAARGLASAVPPGTRLLGIVVRDSIATVDLSREYESGAGTASVVMRLAQLAHTLARVPGVRRALLWIEGRPADVFSAEGFDIDGPLGPSDFVDLAPFDPDPPVVITEPVPGSVVEDSVRVRGTANVFEAHVGLRVRDSAGRVVLETWSTATCGTGCRGTFEKSLVLPDTLRGAISIEAYAPSAEDGRDLHRVTTKVRRVRSGGRPAA